ncbi:hypothetical protein LguiA_010480 [Lonicera macranthoides]
MPVKVLPHLRFLNNTSFPTVRFSLMKPNPSVKPSSRSVPPAFSRVFPHKLKYQAMSNNKKLGFPNLVTQPQLQLGVRQFSVRASSKNKSLIEDEAELSDWVSELRSDSFRKSKLYSDSDGDSGDKPRIMVRDDNRGGFSSVKRQRRDSDSDDYGESSSSRGRGGGSFRGRGGVSSRGGRGNRDNFESFSDSRGNGGLSSRRGRGRGNRDSFQSFSDTRGRGGEFERRGGYGASRGGRRDFGSDDDGGGGYSRGRGMRGSSMGNSRGRGGRFGGGFEGKDEGFMSRRRDDDGGLRGGRGSSMGNRVGRGELGYGRDRGGGRGGGRGEGFRTGVKGLGRGGLMISDTEDVDEEDEGREKKLRGSFRDLISEEDSEVESEEVVDEDSEEVDEEEDGDVIKKASSLSELSIGDSKSILRKASPGGSDSYLSETRFDKCSVSSLSLKAIKDAGYEKMTVVQEATLPVILRGKDVLAKARTGTGKTVAFLLPSIEVVVKSPPVGRDQKRPPIFVLVICPTRELASQAAAEANKLLKYHPSIGVQVVIGGTRLALEQKRMQANPCQILVATPGRLKDHIENTAGFATRLMGVKVLVLDEADHLLDMGFRKDIEKIIAAVPKQRQTLLFSATVPEEVRQICHIALKRDHEYINTVEEGSEETHAQVRQAHLVAPLDKHFAVLYGMLKDHIADGPEYKVLVFCTTAMVTRLVANLLGELNLNVREIHSRKPQSYRTRVSDEFRKSKGLILVTSDVSARGVDYPDVTLVVQVGLPSDKEQYIHRLGRTGRKGREGQGILMLAPWEEFFLSSLKDLPLSKASPPLVDPDTKKKVERALSQVEMKNKEAAYQAWLGYYNSNKTVGRDKTRLVEIANEFSRSMGLDNPPAIPKMVLGKMGLRNVPGLRSK